MKHATRMIKPLMGLFTKTTYGNKISHIYLVRENISKNMPDFWHLHNSMQVQAN